MYKMSGYSKYDKCCDVNGDDDNSQSTNDTEQNNDANLLFQHKEQ